MTPMNEPALTTDWRPRLNDRVLCRVVGEEAVLLDLDSGEYHGLNGVGTRIWELLSENLTVAAICDTLAKEYDVSRGVIEEDVELLLADLLSKRLIVK